MQENSAPTPIADDETISLADYLKVIAKRGRMITCVTGSVFVIAIVVMLLKPNIYTATAKIIPPPQGSGLMGMMGQMGGSASLIGSIFGAGSTADQYVGMLDSEQIKKAIIRRFNLMEVYKKKYYADMYRMLNSLVDISVGKKDGIITISVDDKDPKRAAAIANAYVEELGKLDAQMDISGAGQDKIFFASRLAKAKVDLVNAEDALKAFQAKNKMLSVPEQAQATIVGIAQLKAQLAVQEAQLSAVRSRVTDTSQEVMAQKASIANIRGQIARLEGKSGGGSIPSVGSVPALGQEYLRLMREFRIQETLVEILTKQSEMAKLTEAKNYSTIQIVQSAEAPDRKSKPKKTLSVLLATFAAFFFAVILSFKLEQAERMPEEDREKWREIAGCLPAFDRLKIPFISRKRGG
jgi:uncharacterized protein involved in exopolysaccharide biosynthesis